MRNDYNHCKACTWRRKLPKIQYNIAVCLLEYTGNETRTMAGIAVLKALLVKTPNNDWFQLSKTWDSGNISQEELFIVHRRLCCYYSDY